MVATMTNHKKKAHSAPKVQVYRKKLPKEKEEFGAEFNHDSNHLQRLAEKQRATQSSEPESERTAWN